MDTDVTHYDVHHYDLMKDKTENELFLMLFSIIVNRELCENNRGLCKNNLGNFRME